MNQSSSNLLNIPTTNTYAITILQPSSKIHPCPPRPRIEIHSVSNSPLKLEFHSPSSKTIKTFRFTTGDLLKAKQKDPKIELNPISQFKLSESEQSASVCRICLDSEDSSDLISPCACKGFQQFVHQNCLKMWLLKSDRIQKDISSCEVCNDEFIMDFKFMWKFLVCNEGAIGFWLSFIIACSMVCGILCFYFNGLIDSSSSGIIILSISVIFGIIAIVAFAMSAARVKSAFFEKVIIDWDIKSKV